jgi:hypothetical protein
VKGPKPARIVPRVLPDGTLWFLVSIGYGWQTSLYYAKDLPEAFFWAYYGLRVRATFGVERGYESA